jgi:hypothetical protein
MKFDLRVSQNVIGEFLLGIPPSSGFQHLFVQHFQGALVIRKLVYKSNHTYFDVCTSKRFELFKTLSAGSRESSGVALHLELIGRGCAVGWAGRHADQL